MPLLWNPSPRFRVQYTRLRLARHLGRAAVRGLAQQTPLSTGVSQYLSIVRVYRRVHLPLDVDGTGLAQQSRKGCRVICLATFPMVKRPAAPRSGPFPTASLAISATEASMSNAPSTEPNATAHTDCGSHHIDPHRSPAEYPSRPQGTLEPLLGAAGQRRHRRRLAILSLLCLCGVWISLPDRGRQTPRPVISMNAPAGAAEASAVSAADPTANSVVQLASPPIAPSSDSVTATLTASASGYSPPGSGSTTIVAPQPQTPVPSLGADAAQPASPVPNSSFVAHPIPTEFKLPKFEPGLGHAKEPERWWRNPGAKTHYWEPGQSHPFTTGIKPFGQRPHDLSRVPIRSFERRTTGLHPPIRPTVPSRGRQGRR